MKAQKLAVLTCMLLTLSACSVDKAKSDALGKQLRGSAVQTCTVTDVKNHDEEIQVKFIDFTPGNSTLEFFFLEEGGSLVNEDFYVENIKYEGTQAYLRTAVKECVLEDGNIEVKDTTKYMVLPEDFNIPDYVIDKR